MKKTSRAGLSLLLVLCVSSATAASVPAVSAASARHFVELTFSGNVDFSGNRSILEQYVCGDAQTVKLLNGRTLYRYDTADDSFEVEFTFPQQQDINPTAAPGSYYLYSGVQSAYINENTGMLYYAYDKYLKINDTPANMVVEVVTYDLEAGGIVSTHDYPGENLSAVGADDSGNVYLAVRRQVSALSNDTALYVIDKNGSKQARLLLEDPIDSFCGTANGKFFAVISDYTYQEGGYYSVARQLKSGSYSDGELTVGSHVIGVLDPRYNRPAAVTGGYLATYSTRLYDPVTEKPVAYFPCVPANTADYYNRFCTPNTVIADGLAYVLESSRHIKCYRLEDSTVTANCYVESDIVSFKRCGSGLLALTKSGTQYSYLQIPFSAFTAVGQRVVNLNDLPVYQRTQADVMLRFAQSVPQDYNAPFFEETGSAQAPYREFTLTQATRENVLRAVNYYRWLGGLSALVTADETVWDNAAKGAVLNEKNVRLTGELSHYPERPEDMDEAFYRAAYEAVSSGNIAFGYGHSQQAVIELLRGFLNDNGYRIPGHRDFLMTRNGVGFAAGYTEYSGINSVVYTGDPNPQGMSVVGNNQPAYAWPSPGFFPEEEISTSAVWTVNLNTDLVGLSHKPFTVTITDLTTGEQFARDSVETGLFTTEAWGKFISFLPPEADSYSGKRYKVEVHHLTDSDGAAVTLEYTVDFFSYTDETEIDGRRCTLDRFGNITFLTPDYRRGDVNGDGDVTISDATEVQRFLAELCQLDERAQLAADVNGDGIVSIDDATIIQRYLAEYIKEL